MDKLFRSEVRWFETPEVRYQLESLMVVVTNKRVEVVTAGEVFLAPNAHYVHSRTCLPYETLMANLTFNFFHVKQHNIDINLKDALIVDHEFQYNLMKDDEMKI